MNMLLEHRNRPFVVRSYGKANTKMFIFPSSFVPLHHLVGKDPESMLRTALQRSIQFVPWRMRAAIKRMPIVARVQRWLLSRFVEGKEFVHTVNAGPAKGLRTVVVLPEDKGIWTGTYELDFVQVLSAAVHPGDVCFDIGGWHGFCGGVMALHGASHTVIFEPVASNCERIRKLIDLNPNLGLQLVEGAVGETNGTATFEVLESDSMGKLKDSDFQRDVTGEASITVDVVSLDSWCAQNRSSYPQVIKIDVEGAEILVLRGADRILKEVKPTLLIEAHSRQLTTEVVNLLEPLGYDLTTLETGKRPDGKSEPEVCHLVAQEEVR